jgi:uncharacterized membrane protein YeaQ/YmgE (transglycosylase-associated protein family)
MFGLYWLLVVGTVGWLTGKIIGEQGYGKALAGYADGLDILFGVMGASIAGYLLFWALVGEAGSFGMYATAIVGSIALVTVGRMLSTKLAFN